MNIDLNTKEWLVKYIAGNYNVHDKYVHNLPSLLEKECKRTTTPITLFRGIQPDITWINNEVINYDYNNQIITIKPKTITSWSSNKDVAKGFNDFFISRTFYPNEILCDFIRIKFKRTRIFNISWYL